MSSRANESESWGAMFQGVTLERMPGSGLLPPDWLDGSRKPSTCLPATLLRPGDVVLVDDPGWFLMFGMFATLGAQSVGVPRLVDGPDLAAFRRGAAFRRW